jgi:hypothetical protein
MPEPWLRDSTRSLLRGGRSIGAFFPFLFAIFLAALIALIIVTEWPRLWGFVAKEHSAANSFGARFDGDQPRPPATPSTTATEPSPARATRSDSVPSSPDPWNAAAAPVWHLSPVTPKPSVVATPVPADPAPTTSLSANPAPTVVAPPVADAAPGGVRVPVTIVKILPIQPEKPVRPLGVDEIETLLKQAENFVSVGDFASARVIFARVAEANDARGALAFAATYDPIVLARIGAKGVTPDIAKARDWYAKAKDLGSPDAATRLEALANSMR